MSSLNLIMSGDYVERELAAEFGVLPPSFLPVGVGRLYDLQIALFKKSFLQDEKIHLILPESFDIPQHDREILLKEEISILFIPDNMSLGEAIIYSINMLANSLTAVRILHGDTVINDIPVDLDCVGVHEDFDDYSWAIVCHKEGKVDKFKQIQASSEEKVLSPVACGFFSFSSSILLVRSLISARYNFIDSLNEYNLIHQMKTSNIDYWYDFGHLQNYFHSRRLVTTVRSFNSMEITKETVCKKSDDHFKMKAERKWLTEIPVDIRPYGVRVFDYGESLDNGKSFYTTDYQYAPNLAELFVFSKLGRLTWEKIFCSCHDFLETCYKYKSTSLDEDYFSFLMKTKTTERIEKYANESGFDMDRPLSINGAFLPSMRKIISHLQSLISYSRNAFATVMHGDFCFSNILYNSRTQRISVIDPRGYIFPGKFDIYGDIRYDIAKFSHSVVGFYDLIIANRYDLKQSTPYDVDFTFGISPVKNWLKNNFLDMEIAGIKTNSIEIQAVTTLLFVSMLPLHADRPDRQRAFVANVMRLYLEIDRRLG